MNIGYGYQKHPFTLARLFHKVGLSCYIYISTQKHPSFKKGVNLLKQTV